MAYTEAACIDGAGNLSVLLRIILPLSRNTFFTVMLINFITFWNDYQTPLIYMPSKPTVAYGMFVIANATDARAVHDPYAHDGCHADAGSHTHRISLLPQTPYRKPYRRRHQRLMSGGFAAILAEDV